MPDYSREKIYTIRSRTDDNLIYVGSTIQALSTRFAGHKAKSIKNPDYKIYKTIRFYHLFNLKLSDTQSIHLKL